MEDNASGVSPPARGEAKSQRGPIALVRLYALPLLVLAVALPLTLFAALHGTEWLGRSFPGFLVMNNAVVPTVAAYDWPRDKAALFHGRVVTVDGVPVHSGADVYAAVAGRAPGTMVVYEIEKHGETRVLAIPVRRFGASDLLQTYGILLLFGCATLAIGLTVGFLQPRTNPARVFLFHTAVAGLYPITAVFLHRPEFPDLGRLCLLAECFVAATFFHLALTFPVRRDFGIPGRRLWLLLPYAVSGILFAWVDRGFAAEPPNVVPLQASYGYTAVSLVFLVAMMAFAYWEDRDGKVRARIKAVLPGAILAGAVQFFVFVNNAIAGGDIPVQFGLVTPIAYYAGLAWAIARHDLFDVDRVVRMSFVYGVTSVIVVGTYALVLQVPALIYPTFAASQTVTGILFVLVLAFVFDPLRRGVQRIVDRAFYRKQLDYRATIAELTEVLTTLLDVREVVAQVTRVVSEAMQLESVSVGLVTDDGTTVWQRRAEGRLARRDGAVLAPLVAALAQRPRAFSLESLAPRQRGSGDRDALRAVFADLGAQIVLPLIFRGNVDGVLALGDKRSGQPFDSDAIDLLRTLANQTAIAVQNARSYQELQALNRDLDAQVRKQTEALRASNTELMHAYDDLKSAQAQLVQAEKMASLGQLVAGVAHELNNPASFIHGGLANLEEYLQRILRLLQAYEAAPISDAGLVQDIERLRRELRFDYLLRETPELLRVCFEGSARINRIVEDLRVFARTDSGERRPTAVREGIESSLRLLANQIARAQVRVDLAFGDVPEIRADAGQLNRVWMNLFSNAIDALEGRADAWIGITTRAVERGGHAAVEVEVADNGVGIPEHVRTRIFEPFFSTKPIGKGTGLGLSIAYGAVKSHGGTIEVDIRPEGGTSIRVTLPVDGVRDTVRTPTQP
jgi:signal transduction histidine kinase